MNLPDTTVLHTLGEYQILKQRHEVMFKDGTAIGLHPVYMAGVPQMFLRATASGTGGWLVFDVRHLHAEIEADLLRLAPRDTPGVLFYTLRHAFGNAHACLDAVHAMALADLELAA